MACSLPTKSTSAAPLRLLTVVALSTPALCVRLCVTSAHDLPQALDIWPKNPLPDAFAEVTVAPPAGVAEYWSPCRTDEIENDANPTWEHACCSFANLPTGSIFTITVYDTDVFTNERIGSASLPLRPELAGVHTTHLVGPTDWGPVGRLTVELDLDHSPPSPPVSPPPPPASPPPHAARVCLRNVTNLPRSDTIQRAWGGGAPDVYATIRSGGHSCTLPEIHDDASPSWVGDAGCCEVRGALDLVTIELHDDDITPMHSALDDNLGTCELRAPAPGGMVTEGSHVLTGRPAHTDYTRPVLTSGCRWFGAQADRQWDGRAAVYLDVDLDFYRWGSALAEEAPAEEAAAVVAEPPAAEARAAPSPLYGYAAAALGVAALAALAARRRRAPAAEADDEPVPML